MASDSTLGQRIRRAREARNISQERLAIELGVSWSTVNRYERDKTPPSVNRLRLIAQVLDVRLEDLLDEGVAA